jgi:hypothetical protein
VLPRLSEGDGGALAPGAPGAADAASERFLNELRRYGIRFYSRRRGDRYVDWDVEPLSFGGAPESDRTSER